MRSRPYARAANPKPAAALAGSLPKSLEINAGLALISDRLALQTLAIG